MKKLRHRFLPSTLRKAFLHEILSISAIQGLWREAGTVNANGGRRQRVVSLQTSMSSVKRKQVKRPTVNDSNKQTAEKK
jgi:hypothetical protein